MYGINSLPATPQKPLAISPTSLSWIEWRSTRGDLWTLLAFAGYRQHCLNYGNANRVLTSGTGLVTTCIASSRCLFFPLTFTFHIHFWINMYVLTKTISWDFGWVWALTWKTDPFAMSLTLKREHRTLTYVFLKFRSVTFCRLIVKVWHSFRFVPGCSIFKWHLKTML